MPFLKRGLTWRVCPESSPPGTRQAVWYEVQMANQLRCFPTVLYLSPSLSCLPKRQLNRHSTVFDQTMPMNYSSAPILSCSERSLDILPSQWPPTGRVLCLEDLTASEYWLLRALLTSIMITQECSGTNDQKSLLWNSPNKLKCNLC